MLTEEYPTIPDYPPEENPPRRWVKRLLVGAAVLVPVLLIGAFLAAAFGLSGARMGRDSAALASVETETFGGEVASVKATDPKGKEIPIAVHDGKLVPEKKLHPGETIQLEVVVKRPSAIAWVAGETNTLRMTMRTPKAKPVTRWISVPKKSGVPKVHFSQPVSDVSWGQAGELVHHHFKHPQRVLSLGEQATAGSVIVAAAPRPWEHVGKFKTVTWFPASGSPVLAASPAAGSEISPSTPFELTFSKSVKKVLGGKDPVLEPEVPGKWVQVDRHTIRFVPSGFGAPMATDLEAKLPEKVEVVQADGSTASTNKVVWHVPAGNPLRLQQMLAQLGYMPNSWKAGKGEEVALTPEAQVRAATEPPQGSFEWRYHHTPGSLKALWNPGEQEVITQGALMAFQSEQGLETDGVAGPEVWEALMKAEIAGEKRPSGPGGGYTYVWVSETLPEQVNVWHDGKVVVSGAANTGIPGAETALGTFPVYLRYEETTMSGENPDGSHYSDPGIKWVSYFNGGDALHAFDRASYGSPQSLGCVEMPLEEAEAVYPYTPLGTLVHIES
ncbi:MAG: murein L,D-transpeptidase [Actinobacteria bacterium]|nr:murein L,D-transpeptidase [Actinomycetota bacterium]